MDQTDLSPRVAQETAGYGFQVPIFRMNQGINASMASPQARQSMIPADFAMEDFRVSPEDYQMSLDEQARAGLDQGLLELNDIVSKAAMAGIDATKIDMSNPASIAVNQMFRKKFQDVKNLSKDIRTGVAQQKIDLDRRAQERAEEQYGWAKSNMEYNRDVVRPQAARDQLRQNLEYEEKQVDKKFEKLISPFYTQAKSLLNMDFNTVDPKNLGAINKRKSDLSKSLTKILENPDLEEELRDKVTDFMSQINNVTPLQARGNGGGGGGKGVDAYDLDIAKQGLFTQKATLKDSQGKESEAVGFVITSDGKFKVSLKRPKAPSKPTFAQLAGGDPIGYDNELKVLDPNNEQDFLDINKIIQEGYGDGDDGKEAKAWLLGKVKKLVTTSQGSGSSASVKKGMATGSK